MNNLDLIQKLQGQLIAGHRDAYTEQLIAIARRIAEHEYSSPEEQAKLLALVKQVERLTFPSEPHFLGASAKLL